MKHKIHVITVITSVERLGYFSFLGRIDWRIKRRGARNKQLLVDFLRENTAKFGLHQNKIKLLLQVIMFKMKYQKILTRVP